MPTSRSIVRAATGQGPKPKPKQQPRKKQSGEKKAPRKKLTEAGLPEYARCVLNPFGMPPCGFPDMYNQPTLKVNPTETYLMVSDAAGNAAISISPALIRAKYTHAVATGVFSAASYAQHPDYANLTSSMIFSRTNCIGIKVEYIGNMMNAAGTLVVFKNPSADAIVGATPESVMDDGLTGPARDGRIVSLVPLQDPRYEVASGAAFASPTFEYCYIVATGLPASTTCFRVTVCRHIEGPPERSLVISRGAATSTPANPAALVAVSGITADMQASTDGWGELVKSAAGGAWGALKRAAEPYAAAAAGYALNAGMLALTL